MRSGAWTTSRTHGSRIPNRPTRFREWDQSIRGCDEAGDDNRRVVKRVLTDERANRGQVSTSLLGPEDNLHDKNCFLTSS